MNQQENKEFEAILDDFTVKLQAQLRAYQESSGMALPSCNKLKKMIAAAMEEVYANDK